MNAIVFLGIQGCGKGTQAKLLSEFTGYQHINIGDLLRKQVTANSDLGNKVKAIIGRGELVPDEVVFEIVSKSLEPSAEGVVFDGFPRTKAQAKYLLSHYNVKRVYFLDLSKEEAIQRISARRICPDCGQNYNLMTQKPVKEGVCDSCKGKLIVRPDDKPASIEKRILEFYEQTYQLKEVFDENNLMVNIPADQDIDSIFTQLKADFSKIS